MTKPARGLARNRRPEVYPLDAIVLAGGLGTRLKKTIGLRPKALATIRGRPFLDLLIDELVAQRITRIILSVGYLREQIIDYYRKRDDVELLFCEEVVPLGTGGAVRAAAGRARSDPVLVLNGDSFCSVSFGDFLVFHESKQADISVVLSDARGRTDGGTVELAEDDRILRFLEKPAAGLSTHLINAGIYLLKRCLPSSWELKTPLSLEHDVFPRAAIGGKCFGFRVCSEVIDIGTPERYVEAQHRLRTVRREP